MRNCGGAAVLGAALVLVGQQPVVADTTSADSACPVDTGPATRYLVLSEEATPTRNVTREIEAACGAVTTHYADIGVTVAVSRDPDFADTLGEDRVFSTPGPDRRGDRAAAPPTAPPSAHTPPIPPGAPEHPVHSTTDLRNRQWNLRAIGAASARRDGEDAGEVVVGVLDSGIDATHPDLAGAVAPELSAGCTDGTPRRSPEDWAPSNSAHGTHVAGIIAAADDGRGISGVAAGVRLASVKVVDDHGHVTPAAAVCGLMWAAEHGFTVANSSFVVTPWARACTGEDDGRAIAREAVVRAVRHAHERGTLTVAAASNASAELTPHGLSGADPVDPDACAALPADLREVVSVAATSRSGDKAGYSSYGLGVVDLAAPGGDRGDCVLSTVPGGYAPRCGTSMAAPHVSGVAALVAAHHPEPADRPAEAADRLRAALVDSASPTACPKDYDLDGNGHQDAYCTGYQGYNAFYGHGTVDARAAVARAR